MPTQVAVITRTATRNEDKLNILTCPTHERYETGLAKTGHNFYAWRSLDQSIKDWNPKFAPLPENYHLLNPYEKNNQLLPWVDFDLVLSQNKYGQYPLLKQIADQLRLPLISLEHTLPVPSWDKNRLMAMKSMRGNVNVFISEFSRAQWGWAENEADVIHHGVDTEFFKPETSVERKNHILSVVNDWVNRDWCCGFNLWKSLTQGLPVHPVGDTPGLSQAATGKDLVNEYNTSRIFVNTSLVSPIPTALLEAMAMGCAVVSTATCMIPEIVKNDYNGYATNDIQQMRSHLEYLLSNPDKCKKLGENARKTIEENFSMDVFVNKWDNMFRKVSDINTVKG